MERFELFRQRIIATGLREGPAAALDLLEAGANGYPSRRRVLRWWRMSLLCESGRRDEFLGLFREAMDEGEWWAEKLLRRSDLNRFEGDPEFEALVTACEARRAASETGPSRLVAEPVKQTSAGPPPLLLALHGSGPSARASLDPWRAATEDGWLVVAPVSSQLAAPNAPSWWEYDRARDEIAAHLDDVEFDPDRVVLAGFSRGAAMAAEAAIRGDLPASALIAVGPGPFEHSFDLVPEAAKRGLRAFILAGEHDVYCRPSSEELAARLNDGGVPCTFEVRSGLGHEFPSDFSRLLRRVLAGSVGQVS